MTLEICSRGGPVEKIMMPNGQCQVLMVGDARRDDSGLSLATSDHESLLVWFKCNTVMIRTAVNTSDVLRT